MNMKLALACTAMLVFGCRNEPPSVTLSERTSIAQGDVPLAADISYKGDPTELKYQWTVDGSCSLKVEHANESSTMLKIGEDCAGKSVLTKLRVTWPSGSLEKSMALTVQQDATQRSPHPTPPGTPPSATTASTVASALDFTGKRINNFGMFATRCTIPVGDPSLVLTGRPANGDFALCCVRFSPSLQMDHVQRVMIDFELEKPETQIDFKWENVQAGGTETAWISYHEQFGAGRQSITRDFDAATISKSANHFCFGMVGKGPASNRLVVRRVTYN